MTQNNQPLGAALGAYTKHVTDALTHLATRNVMARIWDRDHTVWDPTPNGIVNRLGWLTVARDMAELAGDLRAFAEDVRGSGITAIVLLGMGGSSLGPCVIAKSIGSAPGFPALEVLDSTIPSRVARVANAIDPVRTLFLVSSKSGETVEPDALYKYFRALMNERLGDETAGLHFVAITDPDTPLSRLAKRDGFRRIFENPSDIGGRYSVASLFGLVPAALIGVDCHKLLDRVTQMASRSEASVGVRNNPSGWFGAATGALAMAGLDKLTIMTSPAIASFGLWAEQLIAESTGKGGSGIIPVAGEPLMDADAYGEDRIFVYMRLAGDENATTDVAVERLVGHGHPVITLDLDDLYDIGAEFFRWEFGTAVACHLLGIHPFDEPDVQAAKAATMRMLGRREQERAASPTDQKSPAEILSQIRSGDYLALVAYTEETDGVTHAVDLLRQHVMREHRIATTFGYGPRYLHSTGQLHKGGPLNGAFVHLITRTPTDVQIPGESYSFGTLSLSQSMADYEALAGLGRQVIWVDLGTDAEAGVLRILGAL